MQELQKGTNQILKALRKGKYSKIIKTIGKENIIVASSSSKLTALSGNPLRVDTGDRDLDNYLSWYMPIITGFKQSHMYKVV